MAQIHALTPEGRLPTAAVEHVREIVTGTIWEVDIPLTADWRTDLQSEVKAHRSGNVVTVAAWRLSAIEGATGSVLAYTLPPGWRPVGLVQEYSRDSRGKDVTLNYNGKVTILNPGGSVAHHSFTFVTGDAPPEI